MKLITVFTFFLMFSSSVFAQKMLIDKEYTYKMEYKPFKKLFKKEEDTDKKSMTFYNGLKTYKKNMSSYYVSYKCNFNAMKQLVGFDVMFVGSSKEAVRDASVAYMQELVQAQGYKEVTAGSNKINYVKDNFTYKQKSLGYDYIDSKQKKKMWVAKYQMRVYNQSK
ncbi:hypothetical protein [Flammeovirga kamogawensis]|uniref:Uncharacterized protein n=1 Tax=Flammeovirga kamogawensis TaxID=373891 RepID=A0ABX8GYD3_9BACT|nr:hypothetical protein [Flammeovirga kamogawensis]MBB6462870.1 hypothetical protein [Flammeovirga kamogawensis]QWG08348.1 hypothetical protein KM029_05275 [Flammeovirga kamogawensis]TRX66645.1 hypothetical protein EO216_00335 [Flammeovirga kamogawensis]